MAIEDRPKRNIRRPLTYWEEFVQTDEWYMNELVADVPEDEMHAALYDEQFDEEDDPNDEQSYSEPDTDGGSFEDEGGDSDTASTCTSVSTVSTPTQ